MRARGQLLSLASVTLQAAQSIVDEGWLGVPDHNSEQRLMLALNNEIAKLETIRSGLAEQKLPEACARLGALQDTFVLQVRVRGNQGTADRHIFYILMFTFFMLLSRTDVRVVCLGYVCL